LGRSRACFHTVVEYEAQHHPPTRYFLPRQPIVNDDMNIRTASAFDSFLSASLLAIPSAVSAIMKCDPTHLILGYSGPGWRGDTDLEVRTSDGRTIGVSITTPGIAFTSALEHLGAKRIAILSPYPAEFLHNVSRYFTSHGFDVAHKSVNTAQTASGLQT